MGNVIKDFGQRIKTDYEEWRSFLISKWNVRRDARQVKRAKARARIKNKYDGKTYYIMMDRFGGINELNREQLIFFMDRGVFTKDQYKRRLFHALAIITSNKSELIQYEQQQLLKERGNE